MLWYCRFQWYPRTTRDQVAKRIVERNQAEGGGRPSILKEWYNLTGGGAGFLLLETDDPHKVTAFLQPYMDLMSWDVHAIYPVEYEQQLQQFQQAAGRTGS